MASMRIPPLFTSLLLLLVAARALAEPAPPVPFAFDAVEAKARALAAERYREPKRVPRALQVLSYDQLRDIRFRPERAVWKNQGLFELQFFHVGFLYQHAVQLNVVHNGVVQPITYQRDLFDYGKTKLPPKLPKDLGFAGFRLHHPLHTPRYLDEVIAFLGASYFRFLGREQQYGISARGLAIDTALPHGEEFPWFRELWLEKPAPDATSIVIHALLDSQSVTGAFRMVLRPDTNSTLDVTAHLFARKDVTKLGIAPLTSMMLFAEHSQRDFDDFRPEVHDSDSLLVQTRAGEWVLRPLINHRSLQVTAYLDDSPRGFGLLQRDREASHYEDLEAHYHRRPSYWVEPLGEWGPGHVELVEIPSDREANDNIAAYWVSKEPLRRGQERIVRYRLHAMLDDPWHGPAGRVEQTRIGSPTVPGEKSDLPRGTKLFMVEFTGSELERLRAEQPVEANVTASTGRVTQVVVQKNEEKGAWRVYFHFRPESDDPADLRCVLRLRGKTLTETWTYLWTAE